MADYIKYYKNPLGEEFHETMEVVYWIQYTTTNKAIFEEDKLINLNDHAYGDSNTFEHQSDSYFTYICKNRVSCMLALVEYLNKSKDV